ncbi:cupin domain-containing protein [Vulcanisaeta thermophila]|uniref:cupin domain-containing protein n=1 Tax=Vulcanisaeta thermophila TaxID=867917 RepID=UPI0008532705|nr:cupin domain-containing protein [Vulcanisaeta thermophila]
MYIGSINNVPQEDVSRLIPGTRGFLIQWLVTKREGSNTFAVRRFVVKPGGRMPLHIHKYVEAVVIIRGRLRVGSKDVVRELGPGDYFFTAPYEPHFIENISDSDTEFICVISYEDDMSIKVLE